MEDYLKTNKSAAKRLDKMYEKWRSLGISKGRLERMQGLFMAKEEYMQAALDSMKSEYGTVDTFIKNALEITDEEKEVFREQMLQ